jgi:hypothetical protein
VIVVFGWFAVMIVSVAASRRMVLRVDPAGITQVGNSPIVSSQGTALHCVDHTTGVENFNVWSFYAAHLAGCSLADSGAPAMAGEAVGPSTPNAARGSHLGPVSSSPWKFPDESL